MVDNLWRIVVAVPVAAAGAFEAALEPMCESVSRFGEDDGKDGISRVEGLCRRPPERASLEVSMAIAAAASGIELPKVRLEPVPERNWLADNQALFAPFHIGRFFICGSDFAGAMPHGWIGLTIDPATAFGSGRHASTAGCLLALDGLRRRRFQRPLDLGCGSGILAMAMALLWRVRVLAVDSDPEAVAVTHRNARLNGIGGRIRAIRADGYRQPAITASEPFDLVMCNILARPLKAMARDLAGRLAPGGVAVLSGFLAQDGADVFAAHRALGLRLERRITIDGWQTLVLAR